MTTDIDARPGSERQTLAGALGEALDLGAGVVTMLLPLFVTAVPGIVLLLVLPAVLLLVAVAVPVAITAALLAPPYLLVRAVRRRRITRGALPRAAAAPRAPRGPAARPAR